MQAPQGPGKRCATTWADWVGSATTAWSVAGGSTPLLTISACNCWTKVDGSWLRAFSSAMGSAVDAIEALAVGEEAVARSMTSNAIAQADCKRRCPTAGAGATPLMSTCSALTPMASAIVDCTAPSTSADTSVRPLSVTEDETTSSAAVCGASPSVEAAEAVGTVAGVAQVVNVVEVVAVAVAVVVADVVVVVVHVSCFTGSGQASSVLGATSAARPPPQTQQAIVASIPPLCQ
mmetsp:Transcript_81657/g.236713  ORF Transcript_81657/g.236713 Transcript_81657/m.236713 type:complete len:234 (-) Transcript_81657:254-955(-)